MAVTLDKVSKFFTVDDNTFYALKDVSLHIKEGEIFGILGPNGAGKSTLLNILNGMLLPDIGSVKMFGEKLNRKILEEINFISGESKFNWNFSPKQVLHFYGKLYNIPKSTIKTRTKKLIKTFDMDSYKDRRFDTLSTGQRMRLVIAKSMINNPKLIMFDEPTLGLDPNIAIKVREHITRINREKNTTIILTSHYTAEVEQLCNRIAFLDSGEIVEMGEVEKVKLKHFSGYDIIFTLDKVISKRALERMGFKVKGNKISKTIEDQEINKTLSQLIKSGYRIKEMEIKKPSLEDYFVEMTR